MTAGAVVVAGLVAAAAALAAPSAPARRLRGLGPAGRPGGLPDKPNGRGLSPAWIRGHAGLAPRSRQSGTGPQAPVRRGEDSTRSVDLTLELIAVGLLAGQPLDAALAAAVAAVPGAFGDGLTSVASALRLGLPAERAWAALRPDASHLPEIGRLLARVADGGAPAARLLTAKAAALRAASQAEALAAARRVGVLAVFPLVVCLLPAFGLLCVIPTVLTALPGLNA